MEQFTQQQTYLSTNHKSLVTTKAIKFLKKAITHVKSESQNAHLTAPSFFNKRYKGSFQLSAVKKSFPSMHCHTILKKNAISFSKNSDFTFARKDKRSRRKITPYYYTEKQIMLFESSCSRIFIQCFHILHRP